MAFNIWANSRDVPGVVCSDARLTDRSRTQWPWADRPITTRDQLYGQAGWDIGINFLSLHNLASQLGSLSIPDELPQAGRTVRRGEIQRLAIHAHGSSGTIFINGQGEGRANLTARTVSSFHSDLNQIGLMTSNSETNRAVILFVGCLAGGGQSGTDLLLELSRIWPQRKVVAFASLGYAPGGEMYRSGDACTEPGMRDTTAVFPGEADQTAGQNWGNLTTWPWASETSPRAKVALNQRIIQGANL
ncbi:MAG: hypothetical protein HY695_25450 [Deltaproteobacteria bacterium]|nr:hypothetical protein [Deltaproteobacteria bacterium]